MKKIKYFLFILLLCPFCIAFSACSEQSTNLIVELKGSKNNSISMTYGNNAGLSGFVVKYGKSSSDCTDVTNVCTITVYDPGYNVFTFDEYKQKVESDSLEIGTWTLDFEYESLKTSFEVNILKLKNKNNYNLKIESPLNNEINHYNYGTKNTGINVTVSINNLSSNLVENNNISGIYMLRTTEDYVFDLQPSNEIVESVVFDELLPGTYYLCALITDDVYEDKFSNFTKVVVDKSKIEVDYTNINISWSFKTFGPYENVTFEQMNNNTNPINFSNLNIIMCSDGDETNNTNASEIKITNEIIDDDFEKYGTFIAKNSNETFNASSNAQAISLKFVPNQTYSDVFEESDYFDTTIKINKCSIAVPFAKSECCSGGHDYSPNKDHCISIYAQYPDIYTISTNGTCNYTDKYSFNDYCFNDAGECYVNYEIKYKTNYEWARNNNQQNNYSCNVSQENKTAKFTLNIAKSSILNYNLTVSYSQQLTDDNSVDLKLVCDLNDEFLDSEYVWEVLPQETIVNSTYTTASGTLNNTEGFETQSTHKTLTISSISDFAESYNSLTVAIKISGTETDKWKSFEKTFLITLIRN